MLELSKEILSKVSFDKHLFQKELAKALQWLHQEEQTHLKMWVYQKFGQLYPEVIQNTFKQ